MTIRKKNSPLFGNRGSEKVSTVKNPKSGNLPKQEDMSVALPGSYVNERVPLRNNPLDLNMSKKNLDHRTYFNLADVQQWVTNSSTEADAFLDVVPGHQISLNDKDISVSRRLSENPGSLSLSQSNVSHVSLQSSAQAPGIQGSNMNYDNVCESVIASGMNPAFQMPHGLDYAGDVDFSGEQYQPEVWSYPTPVDDDTLFATSATVHPTITDKEQGLGHEWDPVSLHTSTEILATTVPCTSQQIAWSPLLAIDTSLSSSYSQNSVLAFQPHTPLSPCIQEDTWCAGQRGALEVDSGLFTSVSLGEAVQFPSPPDFDLQLDTSTLKPTQTFQRTPLSNLESWHQCEITAPAFMNPSFATRRRSSEGETTSAREDPLYQLGPRADGLYHCPFAGGEDCTHKPEKLKCNYDKHLDSHLKPYRCKVSSCVSVPFSSTACLLRHEREAHGMHGHGEKPHLCHFVDCERSQPGNGFPRRWNLGDHMKRVHEYTGQAYSTGSSSPTPSSASSFYQGVPSKRRTSSSSQAEGQKRAKPSTNTKSSSKAGKIITPSTSQNKQRQRMDKLWHEKMAAIKAGLETLNPNDAHASDQINADIAVLQTIGINIRRHEASKLAN